MLCFHWWKNRDNDQTPHTEQKLARVRYEPRTRSARLDKLAVACRMRLPCDALRLNAVVGVTLMLLKRWSSVHAAAAGARVLGFVTAALVPPYSRDCHVLRGDHGDHGDQHRDRRVASPSAATATRSVMGAQRTGFSLPIYAIDPTQLSDAIDAGWPCEKTHSSQLTCMAFSSLYVSYDYTYDADFPSENYSRVQSIN